MDQDVPILKNPSILDNALRAPNPLLDLPKDVRRRIYIHSGIVQELPFSLTEGVKILPYMTRKNRGPMTPFPHQLLFVCRLIHEEVSALTWHENHFVLFFGGEWTFEFFDRLDPKAFQMMKSLSVSDTSPCEWSYRHGFRAMGAKLKKKPLESEQRMENNETSNKRLMARWESIFERLVVASHSTGLKLNIFCSTRELEAAQQVLRLLSRLRLLRCTLHFSLCRNKALTRLARRTVARLIQLKPAAHDNQPFRFLDLPTETQLQILRHTDLICPGEICLKHPNLTHRPISCCGKCAFTPLGCCCPPTATYSSTCTCWVHPKGLFLVNRKVYSMAAELFYANTFQILDQSSTGFVEGITTLSYIESLKLFPPASLQFLRSLHLASETFQFLNRPEGDIQKYVANMQELANFLVTNLTLTLLTLRTTEDTSERRKLNNTWYEYWETKNSCTDPQVPRGWAYYQMVFGELCRLKGLKNLYIHLNRRIGHEEARNKMEKDLEKLVMGDGYDSAANGKFDKFWVGDYDFKSRHYGLAVISLTSV